ncbi:hypothetical protein [Anaeromyxobacter oryzae]|uniref:FG-GAP repeat protein n=1 Tax=Anaeromyxobacter oryzae TaxID=2918170 RepID=A0ABN6N4E9_9BACT|nr:hypothetical protein [Anaeromyxobacter oryzae]BDG06824.1 hypothetical protein AMOR_58200 [Anaeromyxobacter oryzae]
MRRRHVLLALVALAGPAAAQFRPEPMVIPLDAFGAATVGSVASGWPAEDVLQLPPSPVAPPLLRPYRHLLSRPALGRAVDGAATEVAAGFLGGHAAGSLADLVYPRGSSVSVSFGADPATLRSFAAFSGSAPTVAFVRLLPRDGGDVLVGPVGTGGYVPGTIDAVDLSTGAVAERRSWPITAIVSRIGAPAQVFPIRLSPTARALGIDDLAVPGQGEVQLLLHEAAPQGGLAGLSLLAVKAGDHVDATQAPWLPDGMGQGDVHGVAPLDVDFDGVPDLVLSLAVFTDPALATPRGLVWIRSTGALADYGDRTGRWGDLRGHPDLAGITDPVTLRALTIGGRPAIAVWDRASDAIAVITSDATARRLRLWRGSAGGLQITDLWLGDVVGSAAPDLVAKGYDAATNAYALLVFPDAGDAWPELAWAPGSPGVAARGLDHPMSVDARDADGALTVEWLLAGREDPPAGTGATFALPGDRLCSAGAEVPVRVRATDDLGVFAELAGAVQVVLTPPELGIAGAAPPGRLALPPGGTRAVLEGKAWTGCGRLVTFTWGGAGFPATAVVAVESGPTWTRQTLDLPEAAYPALLAGAPQVTLAAVDDAGLASPVATLSLELDATGLVAVSQAADRAALAEGEVAVVRTTLESRLAVPLPGVVVAARLAGLAVAGPARVLGATGRDAGGGAVVLDALPPAGTAVVVELPVRATSAESGAAAAEVRSSGGHLLAPAEALRRTTEALPGCGCAAGSGADALGLAALVAAAWRRRRRAT